MVLLWTVFEQACTPARWYDVPEPLDVSTNSACYIVFQSTNQQQFQVILSIVVKKQRVILSPFIVVTLGSTLPKISNIFFIFLYFVIYFDMSHFILIKQRVHMVVPTQWCNLCDSLGVRGNIFIFIVHGVQEGRFIRLLVDILRS